MSKNLWIKVADLNAAAPIALPANDIRRLAADWGTDEDLNAWDNILTLADEFFEFSQGPVRQQALRRWHDLVLAVGNYKRQTGRIKAPRFAPAPVVRAPDPPDRIVI